MSTPRHQIHVDVRLTFGGALLVTCSCGGLRYRLSSPPVSLDRLGQIAREHRAAVRQVKP